MPSNNLIKRCSICKNYKNINEFPHDRSRKGGHSYKCKKCAYPLVYAYQKTDRGRLVNNLAKKKYRGTKKGIETEKIYAKSNADKSRRYARKWQKSEKGKEAIKIYARKRRKDPSEIIKNIARDKVKYAVRKGVIPRAKSLNCRHCIKRAIHYHHEKGYEKENWFKIIPLCKMCHVKIHRPLVPLEPEPAITPGV